MHKLLVRVFLSPSSSLWIVLELSTTLGAMVDCPLKPLNTSNITAGLKPRLHIRILERMVFANIQPKMSESKYSTLSISPW